MLRVAILIFSQGIAENKGGVGGGGGGRLRLVWSSILSVLEAKYKPPTRGKTNTTQMFPQQELNKHWSSVALRNSPGWGWGWGEWLAGELDSAAAPPPHTYGVLYERARDTLITERKRFTDLY